MSNEACCIGGRFQKVWRVQNSGEEVWPSGCYLQLAGGTIPQCVERVPVAPLPPGTSTEISLQMTSPAQPGVYQSKWRMITPSGSYFGGIYLFLHTLSWITDYFSVKKIYICAENKLLYYFSLTLFIS